MRAASVAPRRGPGLRGRPPASGRASVLCSAHVDPAQPPQRLAQPRSTMHIAGNAQLRIDNLNLHLGATPSQVQGTMHPLSPAPPAAPYKAMSVLEHPSPGTPFPYSLALSSGGRCCGAVFQGVDGHDYNTVWWDLRRGHAACTPVRLLEEDEGFQDVALSCDGQRVVTGADGFLYMWDAATDMSRQLPVPIPCGPEGPCKEPGAHRSDVAPWTLCTDVTGDGRYAVSGGNHFNCPWLCVWDLGSSSGAPLAATILPKGQYPECVAISQDGLCVTALAGALHGDRAVFTWEVGGTQGVRAPVVLPGAGKYGKSAMSADGCTAVFSRGCAVQVWDLATGTLTATLEGHSEAVNAASISSDGRRAVSGGDDRLVKVWDLESKTCLATLEGHTTAVKQVVLSPDGKHVVSASDRGVLRLWQLDV